MGSCKVLVTYMMPPEPSDPINVQSILTGIRRGVEGSSICTDKSRGYAYSIITMNIMQLILCAVNHNMDTSGEIETGEIKIDVFNSTGAHHELNKIGPMFLKLVITVSLRLLGAIFDDDHMRAHMAAFLFPKIDDIERIVNDLNRLNLALQNAKEDASTSEVDRSAEIAELQTQVDEIRAKLIQALSDLDIKDDSIAQKRAQFIIGLQNPVKGSVFDEAAALANTIPLIGSDILEDLKGTVRVFLRKYTPMPSSGGGPQGKRNRNFVPGGVQGPRRDASKRNQEAQEAFDARSPITSPTTPAVAAIFENETNEQIYNTHFRPLFQTAIIGKNICVFGYGYSGSGKTFTLLGNSKKGGIITFMVNDFIASGYDIILSNAKEYYGSPREYEYVEMVSINIISPGPINDTKELLDFLDRVENERKARGRIKATPFNPESSRSHLILQFDVKQYGTQLGRITFMDLGGRENPIEIYDSLQTGKSFPFFASNMKDNRKKFNLETLSDKWKALLPEKSDQEKRDYIVDLVLEGFFINDSLNRLQDYLNDRQGKLVVEERRTVGITNKYKSNNIYDTTSNINSILDQIDGDKKTKFVMMCCVKNNQQSLTHFNRTVKYANSISGANIKNYASYSGINLNEELERLHMIINLSH